MLFRSQIPVSSYVKLVITETGHFVINLPDEYKGDKRILLMNAFDYHICKKYKEVLERAEPHTLGTATSGSKRRADATRIETSLEPGISAQMPPPPYFASSSSTGNYTSASDSIISNGMGLVDQGEVKGEKPGHMKSLAVTRSHEEQEQEGEEEEEKQYRGKRVKEDASASRKKAPLTGGDAAINPSERRDLLRRDPIRTVSTVSTVKQEKPETLNETTPRTQKEDANKGIKIEDRDSSDLSETDSNSGKKARSYRRRSFGRSYGRGRYLPKSKTRSSKSKSSAKAKGSKKPFKPFKPSKKSKKSERSNPDWNVLTNKSDKVRARRQYLSAMVKQDGLSRVIKTLTKLYKDQKKGSSACQEMERDLEWLKEKRW